MEESRANENESLVSAPMEDFLIQMGEASAAYKFLKNIEDRGTAPNEERAEQKEDGQASEAREADGKRAALTFAVEAFVLAAFFILNLAVSGVTYFTTKAQNETLYNLGAKLEEVGEDVSELSSQIEAFEISQTNDGISIKEQMSHVEKDIEAVNEALEGALKSIAPPSGEEEQDEETEEAEAAPKTGAEGEVAQLKPLSAGAVSSDGTVSESYFETVAQYYSACPQSVRESFEADGWKVVVTSGPLKCAGVKNRVLALTEFGNRTIYVGPNDASSVVHEMGHYVDFKNGYASSLISDEVYSQELSGLLSIDPGVDSHNVSTKLEYFAECFFALVTNPVGAQGSIPRTCEYISAFL